MPSLGGRRRWLWWWLGAAAVFAVLLIAVSPWGPMVSKTYELPEGVDMVDLNRGTLVVVEDGSAEPWVTATSDVRLVPFIAVTIVDDTLHLGFAEYGDARHAILPLLRWVPATSWTRMEFTLHTGQMPAVEASYGAEHVTEHGSGGQSASQ